MGFVPALCSPLDYVFGGTPPYRIASPLPGVLSLTQVWFGANGGRFTVTVNGCGSIAYRDGRHQPAP